MAITVTATVEAANVPPRVRLDVSASAGESATTPTRLNPDGTLVPVRTTDGNPLALSGGVGLLYDYEAPFQQIVSYSSLETPANVSATVSADILDVWLIHPGVPALSVPIAVAQFADQVRATARGVFWPMGRSTPIVVTDGARKAAQSSLDVRVKSLDELASLQALAADAGVLLLNVPASFNWGIGAAYISVGDLTETRLVDFAADPNRYVNIPFLVVDRPAGGSQAERTLADLFVYATLGDIKRAYATLHDVLAGP